MQAANPTPNLIGAVAQMGRGLNCIKHQELPNLAVGRRVMARAIGTDPVWRVLSMQDNPLCHTI
jgi:hypothetical protein